MASLLTANGLTKSFGERTLFKDLNFTIDENAKIGFIGANGAGKTTLLRVLTGEEDCEGTLIKNSLLKIGYMEQTPPDDLALTAYSFALGVFDRLLAIEEQLKDIHSRIEQRQGDVDALVKRQDALNSEYFRGDGMVFRAKTRSMLIGLGFSEEELDYPLGKLSGGQKTRLGLARTLLSDANLLLLDEPTNHLDFEAAAFLEDFLRNFNRAFVVISHDRYFLDKVTTSTIELENGGVTVYSGSYSAFMKKKEEAREAARRKYENTVAEIKRIEGIIEQQKRWGQERNYKIIANKQKSIDRLEEGLEKPGETAEGLRFRFPEASRSGDDVLSARDLAKSYGEKRLFASASFEIKRGDRVFLLGPNGCGKSTLYGIIKGTIRPDAGSVTKGVKLKEAYYDQDRSDLSGGKTVQDELWDEYPTMVRSEVRGALAAFLFTGDDVLKPVDKLSGGEKARLALLTVMLRGANFLLLDEPTNHLDIAAREALEQAIEDFGGTVFMISHDRYLINKLATKLLVFEDGTVRPYNFNYDQYMEYRAGRPGAAVTDEPKAEKPAVNDYRRQKEQQSAIRRLESKIRRLEEAVAAGELEIERLNGEINSAGSDFERMMELSAALKSAEEKLEADMTEWAGATEELEKLK